MGLDKGDLLYSHTIRYAKGSIPDTFCYQEFYLRHRAMIRDKVSVRVRVRDKTIERVRDKAISRVRGSVVALTHV